MSLLKRVYRYSGPAVQSRVDQLRYALGYLPRVGKPRPTVRYPGGRGAAVVFSVDFELAWAWRYSKAGRPDPLAYAQRQATQTRQNFPEVLALFDHYDVPATWATVGHLFLERCDRNQGCAHPDLPRVPYFENEYWRYVQGDWFDADPCCPATEAPAWYAPDLIRAILATRVRHEIACHTFSHLNMSDAVCPPEVAEADLRLCRQVAGQWGIALRSLVFPGNLCGNRSALKSTGFQAYRLWTGCELDWPRRDEHGLWQIPGGICVEKPSECWSSDRWLKALRRHVDLAIETGAVCSLWFHPSMHPENLRRVLPALLEHLSVRRARLWITTMAELLDWLESDREMAMAGPHFPVDG